MRHSHAVRLPESGFDDPSDVTRDAAPFSPEAVAAAAAAPAGPALTVETIFAGTSIVTRLLPALSDDRRARAARWFLGGGVASVVLAMAMFATAVATTGGAAPEARGASRATERGRAALASPAATPGMRLLDLMFVGALLGGVSLVGVGLHRRTADPRARHRSFSIGSTADADAPVDLSFGSPSFLSPLSPSFISGAVHELVRATGDDYLIQPTPRMTGLVEAGGQAHALTDLLARPGDAFRLPAGGHARLSCGRTTFVIRSIGRPVPLARPPRGPSPTELPYTIGAVVALGLFVLMIFTIPPDPRSLSLDLLDTDPHLIAFHIAPPAVDDAGIFPLFAPGGGDGPPAAAQPAAGARGPGDPRAAAAARDRSDRARPVAAASRPSERLSEEESLEQVRSAGILGTLKTAHGSHIDGILQRGSGFGDDANAEDTLGHLAGTQIGEAWGVGGIDAIGTGSGGGGTGEATLGVGRLGTLGRAGGRAGGQGYDSGVGQFGGRRRTAAPDVIVGDSTVRGSLDKEIIRRIIHRHINEIRYCYEDQLLKQPRLAGRVGVQFTIASNGKVITSVLQSSTVGNRTVENCTVNAVRRWEFPQPKGGGLVMVSYPFLFTPPT